MGVTRGPAATLIDACERFFGAAPTALNAVDVKGKFLRFELAPQDAEEAARRGAQIAELAFEPAAEVIVGAVFWPVVVADDPLVAIFDALGPGETVPEPDGKVPEDDARELRAWRVSASDVPWLQLFELIAHQDLGLEPVTHACVLFVDPESPLVFCMYDDRGAFAAAPSLDRLAGPIFNERIIERR